MDSVAAWLLIAAVSVAGCLILYGIIRLAVRDGIRSAPRPGPKRSAPTSSTSWLEEDGR